MKYHNLYLHIIDMFIQAVATGSLNYPVYSVSGY